MTKSKKEQKPKTKSRCNGEGSLYFDKSKGRWYGVVTVGFDVNDKPIRKKVSDKSQSVALKKFNELKEQVQKGTYVDKDNSRLEDLVLFLIERDKSLNVIKETSYRRRKDTLKILQASNIAKMPIQTIDEANLLIFFNSITHYSQSNIRKIYGQINSAFKYAQSKEIIYKNPLEQLKVPKSKKATKKISALTVAEQQRFINVLRNEEANNQYRYIFELMLCTGMRCGEVIALDIRKDILFDFKRISIRRTMTKDANDKPVIGDVAKTQNGKRIISMNATCYDILNKIVQEWQPNKYNLLFYDNKSDKVLSTNQVNSAFKRIIERYEIIPMHEEMELLSKKGKNKVKYRKYTYYRKTPDGFELLGKEAPPNWERNFGAYYYKNLIAEKEFNQHMLRHTFATRCIESGMPAKVLQKILGHADIETTLNVYCDVFEEYENDALTKAEEYMQRLQLIG